MASGGGGGGGGGVRWRMAVLTVSDSGGLGGGC